MTSVTLPNRQIVASFTDRRRRVAALRPFQPRNNRPNWHFRVRLLEDAVFSFRDQPASFLTCCTEWLTGAGPERGATMFHQLSTCRGKLIFAREHC